MAKEILLTQAGFEDLERELEYLKTEKRTELAEKIKTARGFGDLSENSEYDEAKNEQGLIEQRIIELEYTIKHAKIVNKEEFAGSGINVGSHVIFEDEDGEEDCYDIVGATEFDPLNGKISTDSPIGAALLGHFVGDTVEVELPHNKKIVLKIKEVK